MILGSPDSHFGTKSDHFRPPARADTDSPSEFNSTQTPHQTADPGERGQAPPPPIYTDSAHYQFFRRKSCKILKVSIKFHEISLFLHFRGSPN